MKASNLLWKAQLGDSVPAHLTAEIDVFEHEIALKQQGKIEDRVFAETRLRRGAYGQSSKGRRAPRLGERGGRDDVWHAWGRAAAVHRAPDRSQAGKE